MSPIVARLATARTRVDHEHWKPGSGAEGGKVQGVDRAPGDQTRNPQFLCHRRVVVVVTEPTNQPQTAMSGRSTAPTSAVVPPVRGRLHLPRTRAGGLWVALVVFALVLLLLLIFILQNGQRSDVYFLGAHGRLPMGVALLLSAIFGVLLVTLPAAVRIVQLRMLAGRRRDETAVTPHTDNVGDDSRS
jgi:uncharacterized integral membrane protein